MSARPAQLCAAALALACGSAYAAGREGIRFAFDRASARPGDALLQADMRYSRERGYGFEPGAEPALVPLKGAGQALSCGQPCRPFYLSVDLPEGSYRVSLRLGGTAEASDTTVRAELRRLMLQSEQSAPGQSVERSFIAPIRQPGIPALPGLTPGAVALKSPRETVEEAWAWDGRLTLEFNGPHPVIQSLEIRPVSLPTLFLLGDSTVADQSQEPYASWGQMLPRFFKPSMAVANLAESGESYRDSIARRRLDKVLSQLQHGDTVLLQFGHNDQKQQKDGSGDLQSYQAEIRMHVQAIRARGGLPVIVSSMERRRFDADGHIWPSLLDYAQAAQQVAQALDLPFIDLNAQSKRFYEALGPQRSALAFATPAPGKIDNTHHNNYGAYQLARLVAAGLRDARLPIAAHLDEAVLGMVDAAKPLPAPEDFVLAPSPNFSHQRPLGDEGHP